MLKLNTDEINALKHLIGNCDGYLLDHILSRTLIEEDLEPTRKILLRLYSRIVTETEGD